MLSWYLDNRASERLVRNEMFLNNFDVFLGNLVQTDGGVDRKTLNLSPTEHGHHLRSLMEQVNSGLQQEANK